MRNIREEHSLELVSNLIKQQFGDVEVSRSANKYARYDLFLKYKEQNVFFEVKERMNKYVELDNFIKYSSEGWQMEMTKYNFLLGKLGRYINLFRVNGEIIIMTWDINKIQKNHKDLYCPQTTEFEYNNSVRKQSLLLKPSQGITYILNLETNMYDIIDFDTLVHKLNKNVLQRS